jgi:hypothetical protein
MVSILEGELAEIIGDALIDADIPFAITVTRSTPGDGPAYDPGPPTLTDHACQGFVDTYAAQYIDDTIILAGDVKIVIVAKTLDIEPVPGDTVTARDKTYSVINVSADPALALYELQARA